MRVSGLWLSTIVLLVAANASMCQEKAGAAKSEKAAASTVEGTPTENWSKLDDLKTGLQFYPPLPMQQDEQPEFVRELVRVQWRVTDPIDLWILRPKGVSKPPVVLYLYSYPSDPDQFRENDWGQRATAGGFAAVGFISSMTGSRYRFRPMKQWFVSELPESMGSSVHDVQLIVNYLAARGDLDTDRVGMIGMGSGASIAILAASVEPRIKSLDLLDPWGDWPDWLKGSPVVPENERAALTAQEYLKKVAAFDPVAYLPKLKTQSIRLEQTMNETITPQIAKERIANSLPSQTDLVKYADAQEHFRAYATNGLSGWIKRQLREGGEHTTAENSAAQ